MITIATNNEGKLREIREILDVPVQSLREAGIDINPDENGSTLRENAYIKAKAVFDILGGICVDGVNSGGASGKDPGFANSGGADSENFSVLSDDTGLFVKALDGAPGVKSARLSEPHKLCDTLLMLMDGKVDREAYFETVLCLLDINGEHYFTGRIDGKVTYEKRGENGFGYDPVFEVNGKTLAEMSDNEKNALSHRKKALEELHEYMKENSEKN
jgi:XTP/dITP diphosphohydrolase